MLSGRRSATLQHCPTKHLQGDESKACISLVKVAHGQREPSQTRLACQHAISTCPAFSYTHRRTYIRQPRKESTDFSILATAVEAQRRGSCNQTAVNRDAPTHNTACARYIYISRAGNMVDFASSRPPSLKCCAQIATFPFRQIPQYSKRFSTANGCSN